MPVIGFMALMAGGILVWSGYLGQPIGKVTRAILDGKTKSLVRTPLDPNSRNASGTQTGSYQPQQPDTGTSSGSMQA